MKSSLYLVLIFLLPGLCLSKNNLSRRIGDLKLKEIRKKEVILAGKRGEIIVNKKVFERGQDKNLKDLVGKDVEFTLYDDELPTFLRQFKIAGIEITKGGGN